MGSLRGPSEHGHVRGLGSSRPAPAIGQHSYGIQSGHTAFSMRHRPGYGKHSHGPSFSLETATLPELHQIDPRGALWYHRALELARKQQYEKSRRVFQAISQAYPNLCRAWVSWAQMEKKAGADSTVLDYEGCRAVLQRGLQLNPRSSCLCQAWGLMELQKGNSLAAIKLLDRSAMYDPKCKPVQRWKLYKDARQDCF